MMPQDVHADEVGAREQPKERHDRNATRPPSGHLVGEYPGGHGPADLDLTALPGGALCAGKDSGPYPRRDA